MQFNTAGRYNRGNSWLSEVVRTINVYTSQTRLRVLFKKYLLETAKGLYAEGIPAGDQMRHHLRSCRRIFEIRSGRMLPVSADEERTFIRQVMILLLRQTRRLQREPGMLGSYLGLPSDVGRVIHGYKWN